MKTIEQYEMDSIRQTVLSVLQESEKARANDTYLMSEVLKHMGYSTDLGVLSLVSNVPSMATVIRYRREWQRQHKSLMPSKEVQRKRYEREALHKGISNTPLYKTPSDF